MAYRLFLVSFLLMATSCQLFETEKVSSEAIFEEEIETIDWKEVDRYPSFPACELILEKPQQKDCFINTISNHLYKAVSHKEMIAVREVYDTVKVKFEVASTGQLSILEIEIDSVLQGEFPELKMIIFKTVDSLQPVAPAYKRGIPVKTQFILPVIVQTD